jgi:hypothetical protein
MFETFKENMPCIVKANSLVIPEYLVLVRNVKVYQRLFQLKYREGICNLSALCDLVGCRNVEEVVRLDQDLQRYLCRVMGGSVRSDLLDMVCPDCFALSLVNFSRDGEEIKRTCCSCGSEIEDSCSEDFDTSLDRDVTYAPVSQLSWTKGLGGTLDHKKDLHKLLDDSSVPLCEFEMVFPEVAAEFACGVEFVVSENGFVYRLMREGRDVVRRIPVKDFFYAVDSLFHAFDVPLRKKKATLASSVPNGLEKALGYAMQLCNRYGVDRKDRDQAFYNTLGGEVRSMKHQLKVQKRHCPEKRMVETMFYICLLSFDKKGAASVAKSELNIDFGLVNYYFDYKEFLRAHDKVNGSEVLLGALEQSKEIAVK